MIKTHFSVASKKKGKKEKEKRKQESGKWGGHHICMEHFNLHST